MGAGEELVAGGLASQWSSRCLENSILLVRAHHICVELLSQCHVWWAVASLSEKQAKPFLENPSQFSGVDEARVPLFISVLYR